MTDVDHTKDRRVHATRAPLRLTVLLTHPVQYYAPLFRQLSAWTGELSLHVLYATEPNADQQGVGFGQALSWDVPLRHGYASSVVRAARRSESVHSDSFFGLDVPEVVDALFATSPDAVVIPGWHSVTFVRALYACRRLGIPTLYRGDSNLLSAPAGFHRLLWRARTRRLLRAYSAYLTVGTRARMYLKSFGVKDSAIFSSPHCVDNEFFAVSARAARESGGRDVIRHRMGAAPQDFVVLFAGKLEAKKRVADAIHAVADSGPSVKLVVVGNGEARHELETVARAHGTSVHWAGLLNQSEMGAVYAAADCLVLPSDGRETWGLVVNEAMAAGLPCVVSEAVGCAPDLIVSGETGETYRLGDVDALAAALQRTRQRQSNGLDFGPACRAKAAQHSLNAAARGIVTAVYDVARRHNVG